jgi:hypothetical protein
MALNCRLWLDIQKRQLAANFTNMGSPQKAKTRARAGVMTLRVSGCRRTALIVKK